MKEMNNFYGVLVGSGITLMAAYLYFHLQQVSQMKATLIALNGFVCKLLHGVTHSGDKITSEYFNARDRELLVLPFLGQFLGVWGTAFWRAKKKQEVKTYVDGCWNVVCSFFEVKNISCFDSCEFCRDAQKEMLRLEEEYQQHVRNLLEVIPRYYLVMYLKRHYLEVQLNDDGPYGLIPK